LSLANERGKSKSHMKLLNNELDDSNNILELKHKTKSSASSLAISFVQASFNHCRVNVYTEKEWRSLIRKKCIYDVNDIKLIESLRKGVPDNLRSRIWIFLTEAKKVAQVHDPGRYIIKDHSFRCILKTSLNGFGKS
jgi:hypothetical protein